MRKKNSENKSGKMEEDKNLNGDEPKIDGSHSSEKDKKKPYKKIYERINSAIIEIEGVYKELDGENPEKDLKFINIWKKSRMIVGDPKELYDFKEKLDQTKQRMQGYLKDLASEILSHRKNPEEQEDSKYSNINKEINELRSEKEKLFANLDKALEEMMICGYSEYFESISNHWREKLKKNMDNMKQISENIINDDNKDANPIDFFNEISIGNLSNLQAMITIKKELNAKLSNEYMNIIENIAKTKKEIKEFDIKIHQLDSEKKAANVKCEILNKEYTENLDKNINLKKDIIANKAELEDVSNKNIKEERKYNELRAENKRLTEENIKLNYINSELNMKKIELEKINLKIKAVLSNKSLLDMEYDDTEKKVNELKGRINEYTKEIIEKESKLKELSETFHRIENVIEFATNFAKKIEEFNNELENNRKTANELNSKFKQYNDIIIDENYIKLFKNAMDFKETRLENSKEVEKLKKEFENLKNEFETIKNSFESLIKENVKKYMNFVIRSVKIKNEIIDHEYDNELFKEELHDIMTIDD